MKERPILFSGPMVRALLAGTKTQTRRAVKAARPGWVRVDPKPHLGDDGRLHYGWDGNTGNPLRCPYGQPGDRLWVREAHRFDAVHDRTPPRDCPPNWPLWFEADGAATRLDRVHVPTPGKLRPGMFMPRWASRITLEVADVRVERLQEISADDAKAEGISEFIGGWWCEHDDAEQIAGMTPQEGYAHLWERINGAGSWAANPLVWVVRFKRADRAPNA